MTAVGLANSPAARRNGSPGFSNVTWFSSTGSPGFLEADRCSFGIALISDFPGGVCGALSKLGVCYCGRALAFLSRYRFCNDFLPPSGLLGSGDDSVSSTNSVATLKGFS